MSATLLHSPADVLRQLMLNLGLGTDPTADPQADWPVVVDLEQSRKDNALTVTDTEPQKFGRSMVEGETLEHYGVQVTVRGRDFTTGWKKARELAVALDQQVRQNTVTVTTVDGTATYTVWNFSRQNLLRQGRDTPTSHRRKFTINGKLTLEQNS